MEGVFTKITAIQAFSAPCKTAPKPSKSEQQAENAVSAPTAGDTKK